MIPVLFFEWALAIGGATLCLIFVKTLRAQRQNILLFHYSDRAVRAKRSEEVLQLFKDTIERLP